MELTVDLNTEEVRDDIAKEAARQLLSRTVSDEYGEPVSLPSELSQRLMRHIDEALKEVTVEAAKPIIEQALAGQMPTYDRYGSVRGESKTLAEKIGDEVRAELTRGSGYGSTGRSLLDGLIRDHVEQALTKELKETLDAAKSEGLKAVREEFVTTIENALRKAAAPF